MAVKKLPLSDIQSELKERGIRLDHFLNNIGISRIHFFLVKKGKRPLTEVRKKKIEEFLKIKVSDVQ